MYSQKYYVRRDRHAQATNVELVRSGAVRGIELHGEENCALVQASLNRLPRPLRTAKIQRIEAGSFTADYLQPETKAHMAT